MGWAFEDLAEEEIPPVLNSTHQDQGQDELRKNKNRRDVESVRCLPLVEEMTLFQGTWARGSCLIRSFFPLVQDETWPNFILPTALLPHLAIQRLISVDNHYYEDVVAHSMWYFSFTSNSFLSYTGWEVKEDY